MDYSLSQPSLPKKSTKKLFSQARPVRLSGSGKPMLVLGYLETLFFAWTPIYGGSRDFL